MVGTFIGPSGGFAIDRFRINSMGWKNRDRRNWDLYPDSILWNVLFIIAEPNYRILLNPQPFNLELSN